MPSSEVLPVASKLSRRGVSLLLIYPVSPTKTIAEGNSSGPLLSFFATSSTLPSGETVRSALRSFAVTQSFPVRSKAMGAFQERDLCDLLRFARFAVGPDCNAPDRTARSIGDIERPFGIEREAVGDDRLLGFAVGQLADKARYLGERQGRSAAGSDAGNFAGP